MSQVLTSIDKVQSQKLKDLFPAASTTCGFNERDLGLLNFTIHFSSKVPQIPENAFKIKNAGFKIDKCTIDKSLTRSEYIIRIHCSYLLTDEEQNDLKKEIDLRDILNDVFDSINDFDGGREWIETSLNAYKKNFVISNEVKKAIDDIFRSVDDFDAKRSNLKQLLKDDNQ